MIKLLKQLLILKYKLKEKGNIVLAMLFKLFGFDFREYRKRIFFKQSRRRLAKAIIEADNLHIIHNGAKIYVFEETGRKGHYIVLTSYQAQRARELGYFSSKSKHFDLDIEACHVIPGESMLKIKDKRLKTETDFVWIVIYWTIGILAFLVIVTLLIKR